jgi:hypothetical protein
MNEIALLNLRLTEIQTAIETQAQQTREAMPEALRKIVTDEEAMDQFWGAAFSSLQAAAQKHTGRLLFSGLKAVLAKATLFVTLGLIVYAIGGWTALVKLWTVIWHQE